MNTNKLLTMALAGAAAAGIASGASAEEITIATERKAPSKPGGAHCGKRFVIEWDARPF